MKTSEHAIRPFKNRNGATSWRITGLLHGERIRRNFKSREDAIAERAGLEIKALQAASGLRTIATSLTEDQARDAEAVFRRLKDCSLSLGFCLDYTLAHYRPPEKEQPLTDAIAEYPRR